MSAHRTVADHALANWVEADPGNGKKVIPSGRQGTSIIALTIGATAETNTLGDPERPGLLLTITASVVGVGSRAITAATKINQAANTVMTFGSEADTITLLSIPYASNTNKCRWYVVANDGVALS